MISDDIVYNCFDSAPKNNVNVSVTLNTFCRVHEGLKRLLQNLVGVFRHLGPPMIRSRFALHASKIQQTCRPYADRMQILLRTSSFERYCLFSERCCLFCRECHIVLSSPALSGARACMPFNGHAPWHTCSGHTARIVADQRRVN